MQVFPDVWRFKATHGLPLDIVLLRLAREDLVPDWSELIEAARRDGANVEKLIRELQFTVKEVYEPDVAAVMGERLALIAAGT